jgi:hypothetical protein
MSERSPDVPRRVVLKRHVRPMQGHEAGGSQPQVFGAEDGSQWMVKARNNPQGAHTLANELVGNSLAALLGGAVRAAAICDVLPELAVSVRFTDGRQWDSGAAFGSELLDNAMTYVAEMLRQAVNPEALLGIVATDTWVGCHNGRQALAVTHPGGGYEIIAVDFGHSVGSPVWTADGLGARPAPMTLTDVQRVGRPATEGNSGPDG